MGLAHSEITSATIANIQKFGQTKPLTYYIPPPTERTVKRRKKERGEIRMAQSQTFTGGVDTDRGEEEDSAVKSERQRRWEVMSVMGQCGCPGSWLNDELEEEMVLLDAYKEHMAQEAAKNKEEDGEYTIELSQGDNVLDSPPGNNHTALPLAGGEPSPAMTQGQRSQRQLCDQELHSALLGMPHHPKAPAAKKISRDRDDSSTDGDDLPSTALK